MFAVLGEARRAVNLEESGNRTVRATDFHEGQVRVVQYVDDVLTSRKFGAFHMELKWDVGLKAPNDLSSRVFSRRHSRVQPRTRSAYGLDSRWPP